MVRARWSWVTAAVCASAVPLIQLSPALADSTQAYCVLSRAGKASAAAIEQGLCVWSQRQGNVNILFNKREYAFPVDEEGKSYTRINRQDEAGPVFTRAGLYTLSVYWRKPAADRPGW